MTTFQMQGEFLKINLVSILGCVMIMYLSIIKWKMGINGYIIGFMSRFVIEFIYEIFYLYFKFPMEAKILPPLKMISQGLWPMFRFSFAFVIGFSVEVFLFETVGFIFFQAPNPEENISLYMSLYQIHISSKFFLE
jgi:hypothetical protein